MSNIMDTLDLNNPISTNPQPKSNVLKTFAETTANSLFPKKDQAIVFNTIEDVPQIEYIKAFSLITSPKNIKFASRISNNRIIISNVQPIIPHDIITNAITNIPIRILSPITFMEADFGNEEYDHIGSFRRQLYIHPEDNEKMPSSILIKFDHTDYWIFFSDDTVTCYLCKQMGHTTNHCKIVIENKTPYSLNNIPPPATIDYATDNHTHIVPNIPIVPVATINSKIDIETIAQQIPITTHHSQEPTVDHGKRPASSDSLNSSPDHKLSNTEIISPALRSIQSHQTNNDTLTTKLLNSNKFNKTPQPTPKKPKHSNSIDQIVIKLDETLAPAKSVFNQIPNLKINFSQLKYIIENTLGVQNPASILNQLDISPLEMIEIIDSIYPSIKNVSIKNRLTRLNKALVERNPSEDQL
ncbi:Zinc finger, CCHC-type [Cinara cedri]|uniref:Zinc finger, CCHC-type n=1 Tax=Cinara cedri TaxID=506608 RepID=A0A5E4NGR3_9HEMI|nr:Zinc finger, CCHC-type [Cinara cedri]